MFAEIEIFVHTSAMSILDFAIRHSVYIFCEFHMSHYFWLPWFIYDQTLEM